MIDSLWDFGFVQFMIQCRLRKFESRLHIDQFSLNLSQSLKINHHHDWHYFHSIRSLFLSNLWPIFCTNFLFSWVCSWFRSEFTCFSWPRFRALSQGNLSFTNPQSMIWAFIFHLTDPVRSFCSFCVFLFCSAPGKMFLKPLVCCFLFAFEASLLNLFHDFRFVFNQSVSQLRLEGFIFLWLMIFIHFFQRKHRYRPN